jgi:ectoine hydroxylase-related dioxygenase (phytanoyl-CoA dioxygenase family)
MNASTRKAFAEDGAVLIERFLNAEQLARCRASYDWCVENPGPMALELFAGTEKETHNENANPGAAERLNELVSSIPFGELFADLWGSKNVWYFAEEVFLKKNGKGGRTPWHQDTSYLPWDGTHWANAWISFEAVPKPNALEMIKGSHRGTLYDGTNFLDANDPTAPLHGGSTLPRLPDIEAERKTNPNKYDVLSWATQPGDVVVLHPGMLHGGAPVDTTFRNRHTLVLRFFGDDSYFRSLPNHSDSGYTTAGVLFVDRLGHLSDGDRFRASCFKQLR